MCWNYYTSQWFFLIPTEWLQTRKCVLTTCWGKSVTTGCYFWAYLTFVLTNTLFFLNIEHGFSLVQTGTCTWRRPTACSRRWQWGSYCQTPLVQKMCSWSKWPSRHDHKRVRQRWLCVHTGQQVYFILSHNITTYTFIIYGICKTAWLNMNCVIQSKIDR